MSVLPQDTDGVEPADDAPSIAQVAQGVQEPKTPADILREAYEEAARNRKPKDLVIPGWGEPVSELHVTFRMVDDYEELRKAIAGSVNKPGLTRAKMEVQLGVETLKAAALGSYALINGEKHDLGEPLGLGLYEALGAPGSIGGAGPQNDTQAIVMLFHQSTTMIMTAYSDVDQWMRRGGRDSEEDALGN